METPFSTNYLEYFLCSIFRIWNKAYTIANGKFEKGMENHVLPGNSGFKTSSSAKQSFEKLPPIAAKHDWF